MGGEFWEIGRGNPEEMLTPSGFPSFSCISRFCSFSAQEPPFAFLLFRPGQLFSSFDLSAISRPETVQLRVAITNFLTMLRANPLA
jgi:hypothetical protein